MVLSAAVLFLIRKIPSSKLLETG